MGDSAAVVEPKSSIFARMGLPFFGGAKGDGASGGDRTPAKKPRFQIGKARWIAIVMLALFMAFRVSDPGFLQTLRLKTFDLYQQVKPRPIPETKRVLIVDIDENSLEKVGQWPWPRTIVAEIVRQLAVDGALAIGFDIFFVEEDRLSGPNVARFLPGLSEDQKKQLEVLPGTDQVLAQMIKASRRVVLGQAILTNETEAAPNTDRKPLRSRVAVRGKKGLPDPRLWIPTAVDILRNNTILEPAGAGHGIVSILPELDGIVRRVPAFVKNNNRLYPALSLEMLRIAAKRPFIQVFGNEAGISRVLVARNVEVPTDNIGRMWPYFSKSDKAKYISAADILTGNFEKGTFRGKLVLMGTSAEGLKDIKTVPTEPFIPGVEVHAQLIESILDKTFLTRPNFSDAAEMAIALIGGIMIIVLVPWIGARWTLLFFLAVAAGTIGTSWFLFSEKRMIFDAGFAVITILALYVTLTYTSYASEEAERRQTKDAFSKYLSPAMVQQVVDNPSLLTLGGDKRDMTLLFCDVRGFTSISELFDAEGLTVLINKLLTPLTDIILERKGTVDNYMGDCIMAFWNAPLDDPNHAENGCRSALAMVEAMAPLNARLEAEAKEEGRKHLDLKVGLGLNSGDAVVGNMGTYQRMDYSVLGDTVNTAARLEGQSKTYGVDIVIGPNTREQVPDFATIELDDIQVKGKTVGLRIYALMGDESLAKDEEFLAVKANHDKMLEAYRAQKWSEARAHNEKTREMGEQFKLDVLCDLYEARIAAYELDPPPADWDGVFIATTK